MSNTLYLIDGSGFIFRAYHALPPLTRADGTPVGAVLGFVNMMLRLLKDKNAHQVAVIFDAARKNFRNDIYPDYKAHRPPPPEDLVPQFPLIRDAARAFSLPVIEQEGFEADDLIATYARLAAEQGINVVIVSSDKDLMQLIGSNVAMMDPIKQTILGEDAVMEKFGVAPDRVADVQALCGDSVDNVPGVPGIGVKTAAALITEYGDLENLLANAGAIKQDKRRETLVSNADLARLSYKLVRLEDHVPILVPLDDLQLRNPDMPDLRAFLQEQGFKSALTRLGATNEKPIEPQPPARRTEPAIVTAQPATVIEQIGGSYHLITDLPTLQTWCARIRAAGLVAIDTETTNLTPAKANLVGISVAVQAGEAAYIPVGHTQGTDLLAARNALIDQQLSPEIVLHELMPILIDPTILKIGHNIKYDLQMLGDLAQPIHPIADTMILSYVLDNAAHGHGLEELGRQILGLQGISYDTVTGTGKNRITFDQVPIDQARDYAAEDADLTLRLYQNLSPRLVPERMAAVYHDLDLAIVPIIARMEARGINIDVPLLKHLSIQFGGQLTELEAQIQGLVGRPFNVNSPKQLGGILFDEMKLPGGVRTKTGDWSTNADVLEDLAATGHAIVEHVLAYRGLAKLKSTYTDALVEQINQKTGRVHTSYGLALTNTGRLSSSDPNLQNIPIRTETGRQIRRAFIPAPGYQLISVDYSQIELRLIAEIAQIPALLDAFAHNADIHAITAAQVFGIPVEGMDPMIRRQAKAINFGIIYGISGFGLARQLGIDTQTANQYIKTYFERFPQLKDYFENAKEEARQNGFVRTLYGRKIIIDGMHDKNTARRAFAERQAINAPIQGSAADLMKRAMVAVDHAIKLANQGAHLLLQVHDELVLEAKAATATDTAELVKQAMESVAQLGVPITASYGVGDNWGDAH